jgi:hypothetical protein
MAHFAKLGVGNVVEQVVLVSNDIATNEQAGVDFLNNLYNTRDVWKQTSYNNNFRKNFAGVGYTYDNQLDAFIPERPFNSWILDENTCTWKPPIQRPTEQLEENQYYSWNESVINWEVKTQQ